MRSQFILLVLLFPSAVLFAQGESVPPFARNLDQSLDQCFRATMLESTLETWMPAFVRRELGLSHDQKEKLEAQIEGH